MPAIRIDFDDEKVKKKDIVHLSTAIQTIVSRATNIDDVFVYANSSQVKNPNRSRAAGHSIA